jgi:hypothetical protein
MNNGRIRHPAVTRALSQTARLPGYRVMIKFPVS